MLTMNVDLQDRLINGQLVTVKHIAVNDQRSISKIYIKYDDNKVGLNEISMDSQARDCGWVPIERAEANIRVRASKDSPPVITTSQFPLTLACDSPPVITTSQFPLTLAWGCTVQKVQGLTLEKVVISFDLVKQQIFNYGQMYVALSRVTSIDNLYLIGSFTLSVIKADPRAIHEYQRLRNERQLSTLTTSSTSGNYLKIALLNNRSQNKHDADISKDNRLPQAAILCLIETPVMPEQDIIGTNCLDQFHFYHNKLTDKFESLLFACTNSVDAVSHHQIPGNQFFLSEN